MAALLGALDLFCPPVAARNETVRLRLFLNTVAIADAVVYVIYPNSNTETITQNFELIVTGRYECNFTFNIGGLYSFIAYDSVSGNSYIDKTYCAEWASRIDIPVSQLGKQRSDIQRIFGKVKGA